MPRRRNTHSVNGWNINSVALRTIPIRIECRVARHKNFDIFSENLRLFHGSWQPNPFPNFSTFHNKTWDIDGYQPPDSILAFPQHPHEEEIDQGGYRSAALLRYDRSDSLESRQIVNEHIFLAMSPASWDRVGTVVAQTFSNANWRSNNSQPEPVYDITMPDEKSIKLTRHLLQGYEERGSMLFWIHRPHSFDPWYWELRGSVTEGNNVRDCSLAVFMRFLFVLHEHHPYTFTDLTSLMRE